MADLIRVRLTGGVEATVGADYLRVWPENIDAVLDAEDLDSPESTPEPTPAKASPSVATKETK